MALTINEFRKGIHYWRAEGFPNDFHNAFYEHDLTALRANGLFNQEWWVRMLSLLKVWKATRGTADGVLTSYAQARFEELSTTWASAVAPHLDGDIAGCEWHQIAKFPWIVAQIKAVESPVFTSKFCHFLAPSIFPVTDNKLLGLPFPTYEAHFRACRAEWLGTDNNTQDEFVKLLTHEVGAPLFKGFPMKCKLIELCLIGRFHHGTTRTTRDRRSIPLTS